MKKFLVLVLIATSLQFSNCKEEKDEPDPLFQLLALQSLLTSKNIFFNRVRYLDNKFYGVGSGGQIYVSADGDSWTRISLDTNQAINDIGYINNRFTAIGNSVHYTSADGISWSDISSTFSNTTFLRSLGNFGSTLVAFGSRNIYTSTNGLSFSSGVSLGSSLFPAYYESASNSNRMVVVGAEESNSASIKVGSFVSIFLTFSSNGVTGLSSAKQLLGIAYNGTRFVAVGNSGNIYYSADGLAWTAASSGVTSTIRAVVYAKDQFIAVGMSGLVLSSPDGINWTSKSSGSTVELRSVAYGNDKLVAVGRDTILVSSDAGNTWVNK
ncbi:WD40/YVTN/BNR-like repeat-containing protein [Leptospira sp. GIMC2001]|uniref:WD40/YVTN/BNR-like repeat-containing protein n=1 Tax=Leptospira sp. GIMC2001 TaxID=1513297 RepID=UPI00234A7B74|nr:hypothetical protein [Leptospira sp. GIMC2001]WCL48230.1 hypothetical protein O4O04_13045 [Leptospira sp. GIMC2001]